MRTKSFFAAAACAVAVAGAGAGAAFAGEVTGPPGTPGTPGTLGLKLARTRSGRLSRTVNVSATCDTECDLSATGTLSFSSGAAASKRLRGARAHAAAGQRVTLKLRLSKKQLSRAKRVVRRGGRVAARVVVTARAGGTTTRTSARIRLR